MQGHQRMGGNPSGDDECRLTNLEAQVAMFDFMDLARSGPAYLEAKAEFERLYDENADPDAPYYGSWDSISEPEPATELIEHFHAEMDISWFVDIFAYNMRRSKAPINLSASGKAAIQRRIDEAMSWAKYDALSTSVKASLVKLGKSLSMENGFTHFCAMREFGDGEWESDELDGEELLRDYFGLNEVAEWINAEFYGVPNKAVSGVMPRPQSEQVADAFEHGGTIDEYDREVTFVVTLDPMRGNKESSTEAEKDFEDLLQGRSDRVGRRRISNADTLKLRRGRSVQRTPRPVNGKRAPSLPRAFAAISQPFTLTLHPKQPDMPPDRRHRSASRHKHRRRHSTTAKLLAPKQPNRISKPRRGPARRAKKLHEHLPNSQDKEEKQRKGRSRRASHRYVFQMELRGAR